jgi:hypothetical protein
VIRGILRGTRVRPVLFALLAVALVGSAAFAQRRQGGGFRGGIFGGGAFGRSEPVTNPKYNGQFAFARLRYATAPGGYYYCGGIPAWSHGYYPCRGGLRAETNLMKIMDELSYLNPHVDDSIALALDDPELSKYPVSYMTEAGFWTLTDKEAAAFRAYLLKGGFAIFDDFRLVPYDHGGGGWETFEENMQRVLPGAQFVDLDPSHPIFHSFFEIDSFDIIPQFYDQGRPILRGLFENNDPTKRLMAIVNLNTDIANFWEFSATGLRPIDESNQAYKLGVNYIIYGMTH